MQVADTPWIELSSDDFVDAIKRLKPGRMLKSFPLKELQIGLVNEEAIFCIEGATTRRPASGVWNGLACVSYGMLLPYLKVKPEGDRVRLGFDQGRLRIGSARFQSRWIDLRRKGNGCRANGGVQKSVFGLNRSATPLRGSGQCGPSGANPRR